jgi:hypothetical protein
MLVKLLTNLGSNDWPDLPFLDGETREVSDGIGAKLLAQKLATAVQPTKDKDPPAKPAVVESEIETPKASPPPAKHQKPTK